MCANLGYINIIIIIIIIIIIKGIRPVKTGCQFVGGDDLTGALRDL